MPQLVAHTVRAATVRTGDRVNDRVVATKRSGPKWTELREEDGTLILRMLSEDELTVRRSEPTEEERAAKEAEVEARLRERNNAAIFKWVTERVDDYEDRMRAILDGGLRSWSCSGAYEDMMIAEAEHKVALHIKHLYDVSRAEDRNRKYWDEIGEVDWAKAHELWTEDAKKKLLERGSSRALSRSTSVISNLVEDVEREVTVRLLCDTATFFIFSA